VRGKFLGRCAALQSEGEAFIVVPGLPAPQGGGRRLEVREALPGMACDCGAEIVQLLS